MTTSEWFGITLLFVLVAALVVLGLWTMTQLWRSQMKVAPAEQRRWIRWSPIIGVLPGVLVAGLVLSRDEGSDWGTPMALSALPLVVALIMIAGLRVRRAFRRRSR